MSDGRCFLERLINPRARLAFLDSIDMFLPVELTVDLNTYIVLIIISAITYWKRWLSIRLALILRTFAPAPVISDCLFATFRKSLSACSQSCSFKDLNLDHHVGHQCL